MIRIIRLELARLDYGEEEYNSTIILIIHTNMQWFYMLSVDILKRIMKRFLWIEIQKNKREIQRI